MPKKNEISMGPIADYLYEVGILNQTPRSGFHFLGSGRQTVAEHIHRAIHAGYVLARMEGDVAADKVIKMCLWHDLAEARTSDLNYVHQKYAVTDEEKARADLASTIPWGEEMKEILREYDGRQTKEALVAKDADNLEWILSLKEQADTGNSRAESWIPSAVKRLKTKSAKKLVRQILKTDSDHWWFADKEDEWWVSRKTRAKDKE